MSNLNIKEIENILNKRYDAIFFDHNPLIQEINRTKGTIDSYNGRIFLEMLQNADDAQSDYLHIKIEKDKNNNTLMSFINGGNPFSNEGFRSLIYTDLSSKTGSENIGEKGLGFRSLLNVTNDITICSNDIIIEFKEENRKIFYEKYRDKIEKNDDIRNNINKIPLLLLPNCRKSNQSNSFTTKITIVVKKECENDLRNELTDLSCYLLLFLKKIRTIVISDGTQTRTIKKEKLTENTYKLSDSEEEIVQDWYIKKEKIKYYKKEIEIGIAYPLNGELPKEHRYIFSYLPTNINFDLPLIIHGRFNLTADRNDIVNDKEKENEFIILKILNLLSKEIIKHTDNKESNWNAYNMIIGTKDIFHHSKLLEKLGFYAKLEEIANTAKIYPCVDNKYRSQDEIKNYGNSFAGFLLENPDTIQYFSEHIKPYDTEYEIDVWNRYDDDTFVNKICKISEGLSNENLSKLIYLLITEELYKDQGIFIPILLDKNNEPIKENTHIFISKIDKNLPEYADKEIKILNKKLYTYLIKIFKLEEEETRVRELAKKLKDSKIFGDNISVYEKSEFLKVIINIANDKIHKKKGERLTRSDRNIIDQMFEFLYDVYSKTSIKDRFSHPNARVPVTTNANTLSYIDEVYLTKDFPISKHENLIFGNIRTQGDYIKLPKSLRKQDKKNIQEFLKELKINVYLKISEKKPYQGRNQIEFNIHNEYGKYIADKLNLNTESTEKIWYICFDSHKKPVKELDKNLLEKIKPEHIIFLINEIEELKGELENQTFDLTYKGERGGNKGGESKTIPTYIAYQIRKSKNFNNYLLDKAYANAINKNHPELSSFNIEDEILKDINKEDKHNLLKKVGATSDISDFSQDYLSDIIKKLDQILPDGKHSNEIYTDAVYNFTKNREPIFGNFKLYTKSNKYVDKNDVYLVRNPLPASIQKEINILDFPQERCKTKDIIDFFNIKEFTSKIELSPKQKTLPYILIDDLKPYILAFRLLRSELFQEDKKQEVANKIQNLTIKIIDNYSKYKIDDNIYFTQENDILQINNSTFCISTSDHNKISSNTLYYVYTLLFKLTSKKEDKLLFESFITSKDKFIDPENYGDILEESFRLLKLKNKSEERIECLKSKLLDKIKDNNEKEFINSQLQSTRLNETIKIIDIIKKYNITLNDFNEISNEKLKLYSYHQKELESFVSEHKDLAKHILWKHCEKNKKYTEYLQYIDNYQNIINCIEDKHDYYDKTLIVDYREIVKEEFRKQFWNLELQMVENIIEVEELRKENESNSNLPYGYTLNESEKSCLYFTTITPIEKNKIDYIKENSYKIIPLHITSEKNIQHNKNNIQRKHIGNAQKNNARNNEIGNLNEDIVFNEYKKIYTNVQKISHDQNSDGYGYDLTYENENGKKIFVEIKTFNKNYFYLSDNERKVGEEYSKQGCYELTLVSNSDKSIHSIPNFFKYINEDDFYNNSKFKAYPMNWKIELKPNVY